jgi:hypothetical protein
MREPKFRKKSSKKLKSKHFRKKHSMRRTMKSKRRGGFPPQNQQNQQNKPTNPEPIRPSRQKASLQRPPSPDKNDDKNDDNDDKNDDNNDNNDNNNNNNNNNRQGGRYGISFFHGPKKPQNSVANEELYKPLLGEHHTKNAKTSKTSNPFIDRLQKTMRFFHKKQEKKQGKKR